MRDLNELNEYRLDVVKQFGWNGDGTCGGFKLPSPIDGQPLRVIASSNCGWDHVSVSRASRCPNWPEMAFIKEKFFEDSEVVIQLHVPSKDHVNCHPNCLHLWRPLDADIPMPPKWMIGPK